MQVPILNGIYTDTVGDFRSSYPRNLVPIPKGQGISKGYLRPAEGIVAFTVGPGKDRGGINWNGSLYRVMGSKLCKIKDNGTITIIGDVGNNGNYVTFAYSFDKLAIASNSKLYYVSNDIVSLVTDGDLGPVNSVIWVDGYFMTTDGTSLVVTDLSDPYAVNPLKYGSAEADPDPIIGICKLRNEPHAMGRYTIEAYSNVGSNLFPFQRISGSEILKGTIGPRAFCVFADAIAFLGSGSNDGKGEPCSIWLGLNGACTQLTTREIDTILQTYTEADLANVVLEARIDKKQQLLYVHLKDKTLVYDHMSTSVSDSPVWYTLDSGLLESSTYRARDLIWIYNKWIAGDPTSNNLGVLTNTISSHYEEIIGWDFGTTIVYNATNGVLFHEIELVALTGNVSANVDPIIWTSYSTDGSNWSQEKPRRVGKQGQRSQRLNWLQQGNMLNWRIQKFRGNSDAYISPVALECRLEQLSV